jgi:hypothetical protein
MRERPRPESNRTPEGTALQAAGPTRDHTKANAFPCPRQESNLRLHLRRVALYPLSYEGNIIL